MTKTKTERIKNKERKRKKVSSYYVAQSIKGSVSCEQHDKFISKLTETSKPCSCWMCGNPRKYLKEKTIQERRFEALDISDEMNYNL